MKPLCLAIASAAILGVPALAGAQPAAGATDPAMDRAAPTPSAPSSAPAYNPDGTVMSAAQMPPAQAAALASGDNRTVTNGPVPDTPQNRAKFGRPMSNGGAKTAPVGN
ncbi:MAG: hypothetical protein ABI242_01795 [Caulobacteraceae bacterium]